MTEGISLKDVMESIGSLKQSFQESIEAVNARVDDLAQRRSRSRTPSPRRKEPERSNNSVTESARNKRPMRTELSWCDRTDTVDDLPPLTDKDFRDDEEDLIEEQHHEGLLQLSEGTSTILTKAITCTLDNKERREIRGCYPVPETDSTRVPKLDEIFTSSESRFQKNTEAKTVERDLLHIQACTLDAARPLVDLIEGMERNQFTPEEVKSRAIDTLKLLGNSIAHTSQIRRKRVLKICNPDISSLAENKELFAKAPPMLFGEGFENKIKDRAEALKVLHKGQSSAPQGPNKKSFFRGNRPSNPQRGGGYGFRGRGQTWYQSRTTNRYSPYNPSANNGRPKGGKNSYVPRETI